MGPDPLGLVRGEWEPPRASGVAWIVPGGREGVAAAPLLLGGHSRGPVQGYRWMAVTSVGVLVWLGPWLLEPRGALGAGLEVVWEASLRLSLSAASICS